MAPGTFFRWSMGCSAVAALLYKGNDENTSSSLYPYLRYDGV